MRAVSAPRRIGFAGNTLPPPRAHQMASSTEDLPAALGPRISTMLPSGVISTARSRLKFSAASRTIFIAQLPEGSWHVIPVHGRGGEARREAVAQLLAFQFRC